MSAPRGSGSRRTPVGAIAGAAALAAAIAAVLLMRAGEPDATPREPASSSSGAPRPAAGNDRAPQPERHADETRPDAMAAPESRRPRPPIGDGDDREPRAADGADARVALAAIRRAKVDPSQDGTTALVAMMRSDDAVVVAEAAKALVLREDTDAIASLATIDLRNAGGAGLSVIEALGKLGGMADAEGKAAAVNRLLAMLAEAKQHDGPETPGHLLQIYEALGQTRDPRAAGPLESELADAEVGRAPKVVVVQALALIGEPRSRAAMLRLRAQELGTKLGDAFEAEVQRDLLVAIDAALAQL
jgi:hypothetical protein